MEVAQFLADTVIILKREHLHRSIHRSLEIMKSRGQDYEAGKHTLRITGGKGLEVFRRVQIQRVASWHSLRPSRNARSSVRAARCPDRRRYLRRPPPWSWASRRRQTVLGVQLLLEGALKQGKRCLLVSLDEHPAQSS